MIKLNSEITEKKQDTVKKPEFDLISRRVSTGQVIVRVLNKNEFDILTSPVGLEHDLIIDVILNGFTLPWYVYSLGPSAQSHVARSITKLFKFIEINLDIVTEPRTASARKSSPPELSPYLFRVWFDHLKEHESHYVVWNSMIDVLKILTKSLDAKYGKTTHWPKTLKQAWKTLKAHIPSKPQHVKLPPLGPYLGIRDEEFSNRELFMGLRYGSMWLLKKIAEYRRQFAMNDQISTMLLDLKGQELSDYQRSFTNISQIYKKSKSAIDQNLKLKLVASESWNIVRNDNLLSEWQFYCFSRCSTNLVDHDPNYLCCDSVRDLLLQRCVNPDGSLRARPRGFGQYDEAWAPVKKYFGHSARNMRIPLLCFWGVDWIIHTALEKLLMVWILASERAQKSGIEKLTFDGLIFSSDNRSLQISTQKMRRLKESNSNLKAADVETMVYRRREPAYSIYNEWLHQAKIANQQVRNYNVQRFFIPNSTGATAGHIAKDRCSIPMLPLHLITIPGSSWQKAFLKDTSETAEREAKAFIAILRNRFEEVRKKRLSRLTVSPIGQSLIVEQQRRTNLLRKTAEVESEAMGHTSITGRNIYKDGFRELGITEILEPIRDFSRKVGDKKIQLAMKMAQQLSNITRKISLAEAQELSGVGSSAESQDKLLNLLDENDILTVSGELNLNGEILIVQTDMTAALMAGYMDHLENGISKLEITYREESGIRHIAKLIQLHQIFQSFPMRLQKLGRQLANEMDFRFPPLN